MCRCTPTILVVENRPQTLLNRKRSFSAEGFRVITASSPEEAKKQAAEHVIHLALIDVRLIDDQDETDLSGLELAAYFKEKHPLIERVVTTAQKWERIEELMLEVYKPDKKAVRLTNSFYQVERYRPKEVSRVVRDVFTRIPLNPELKLTLHRGLSWETLVGQLKQFTGDTGNDRERRERGIKLLQDLTCLLFSAPSSQDHQPTEVHFLSTSPGYSPCTVAMVRPKFADAKAAGLAIKFGPRKSIDQESYNYNRWVKPFIQNSTRLEHETVWCSDIGALLYTFAGDNVKSIVTLRKYYQDKSVTTEQLCKTLEHLFARTCEMWYTEGPKSAEAVRHKATRLDVLYRDYLKLNTPTKIEDLETASRELLNDRLSPLKLKGDKLQLDLGDGAPLQLPNPLSVCLTKKPPRTSKLFPVVSDFTITHGDLHAGNVIVNEGRTRLIDFYKTGPGHSLRDFAELESDIKFNVFNGEFRERYELDRALLIPERWTDEIALKRPTEQQARAVAAIRQIRTLAGSLTGIQDMKEYHGALLFYALKAVSGYTSYSSISQDLKLNRTHALLSAALICQQLIHPAANKKGTIFLAHDYSNAFKEQIHKDLNRSLVKAGYQVLHPLDEVSSGEQVWPQARRMIEQSDVGFYEISTGKGNVYFELGYAIGIQKPYFAFTQKNSVAVKRPPLLGGEVLQVYTSTADLKQRVSKIMDNRTRWEESFFFNRPEIREELEKIKVSKKSALLLVGNTSRQKKEIAPLLETFLAELYGWQVEILDLETEVNLENFMKKVRRAKLVVGCLASDRAAGSRYANAELALALGVSYGLQKNLIILQEKNCQVLTNLATLTITFQGAHDAGKALKTKLQELFPRRTTAPAKTKRTSKQLRGVSRSVARKRKIA
jgi:CheY-like chemotaxis protein/nucleoside 2-deoxyribosyltransferase